MSITPRAARSTPAAQPMQPPSLASGGPAGDQRLFLTATEVGRELGIQKSRVYELAAGGLLPVVRLGRRVLFPRRGLEELAQLAIERVKATMPPPGRRGY